MAIHSDDPQSSIKQTLWLCSSCGSYNALIGDLGGCSVCLHKRDKTCLLKTVPLRRPVGDSSSDQKDWDEAGELLARLGVNLDAPGEAGPIRDDHFAPRHPDIRRGDAYGEMMNPISDLSIKHDAQWRRLLKLSPEDVVEAIEALEQRDFDANVRGQLVACERSKYFGFKPEDLIRYGCIIDDNVKPNNLTCKVHPIFHQKHWPGLPQIAYDFLLPSLRLSTNLLNHPLLSRFWVTLLYGERIDDSALTARTGIRQQRILDVRPTPENIRRFRDFIDRIGRETECISFHFSNKTDHPLTAGRDCFGVSNYVHHSEVRDRSMHPKDWKVPEQASGEPQHRLWHAPISLSYDFYASITKRVMHGFPDENQRLRFNLFFAATLIHEVVHGIHFIELNNPARNIDVDFAPGPIASEPYFRDWNQAECGWTWEQYVLGGILDPVNNDCDCQYGLTHSEFPEKRYGPDGANWKVYRMVPMSYISWIQQQEVWDQSIHPIFPSQLKLPDRGFPVSIGYDLTTTLTREEIQREKLELIGMDAETIKNMGLFGPPESKSTLSSIQLLRESLRETDPDEKCLKAFYSGTQAEILKRPDMSRNKYPDLNERQYNRLIALDAKMHEENKIKHDAARRIFEFYRGEDLWEREEADIVRQLDEEGQLDEEFRAEEIRTVDTSAKTLHYISLEEWAKNDKELKDVLDKQERYDDVTNAAESVDILMSLAGSKEVQDFQDMMDSDASRMEVEDDEGMMDTS